MSVSSFNPSVLVVNNSGTKPISLINQITKNCDIKEENQHKLSQLWKIETKYYTAHIDIHGITENFQRSDDFNEAVKALIIHIDCNIETCLTDLKKWDDIEHECDPEIKLFVSDSIDTKAATNKITEWCLKRGYEFIVLSPADVEDDHEEEIIKEKLGIDRVIEALQTYVWPNLEMKTLKKPDENAETSPKSSSNEQPNSDMLDDLLCEGLDDFTELFGRLHTMKQSLQSMPISERKLCAEQMVTAFWKAIGGDEEELDEL